MNENIIDVLIFIYENYMESEEAVPTDQIMLEDDLIKAGFRKNEIEKAFNWLDELAWRQGEIEYRTPQAVRSMRIFTDAEQQKLDLESQGLLLDLVHQGIIDAKCRELVIERAMAIESPDLTTDELKWIVLLVLLNQPGQESAFALMQELVYSEEPLYLH